MGATSSREQEEKDTEYANQLKVYYWGKPRVGYYMSSDVLEGGFRTNFSDFFEVLGRRNTKVMCVLLNYFVIPDYRENVSKFDMGSEYKIIQEEPTRNYSTVESGEDVKLIFESTKPLNKGIRDHQEIELSIVYSTYSEDSGKIILKTSRPRPYFSTPGAFNEAALYGYEGYDVDDIRWEWIMFWSEIGKIMADIMSDSKKYARFKVESFRAKEGPKMKAEIVYAVELHTDFLWSLDMKGDGSVRGS
jgi:hypothetical protein